mgnify:CR=1 FL=1
MFQANEHFYYQDAYGCQMTKQPKDGRVRDMKLWILGTERGRPVAVLAKTRPPIWVYNGYHHIGKPGEWDESMVLNDDQCSAFQARKIPPGKFHIYHVVRQRNIFIKGDKK